ncbi:hypothetical protein ABZZ74_36540 [Streptomyces sp. NPDC006476]|uniref:hypothetical protein n=1 Tax=Streptomyces sp. NPDC006476 TaxID=3157175 RepID=UPI0033B49778
MGALFGTAALLVLPLVLALDTHWLVTVLNEHLPASWYGPATLFASLLLLS